MAENDRVLNTVLKFTVDGPTLDKVGEKAKGAAVAVKQVGQAAAGASQAVKQANVQAAASFDQIAKKIEEAKRKANELRENSERLTSLMMVFTAMGAALTGPIVMGAMKYVQYAGMADETSRKWMWAMSGIEKSQNRIGNVGAQAILPYLDAAAKLAEKSAGFVEKHPEVIKAALNIGAAVTSIGILGMAVSKGIRIYADFKSLAAAAQQMAAARMMESAANKQLAAATEMALGGGGSPAAPRKAGGPMSGLAGLGLPLLGIAGATTAIAGGIHLGGQMERNQTRGREWAAPGLSALSSIPGLGVLPMLAGSGLTIGRGVEGLRSKIDSGSLDNLPLIGGLIEKIKRVGDAADEAADPLEDMEKAIANQQAVQRFIQYRQEEKMAAEQYNIDRNNIEENFAKQRAQIERQYEQQRTNIVEQFAKQQAQAVADFQFMQARQARDFARSEQQAEEDYYKQRSEAAKDFSEETQRIEEDHQRQMEQLRKEHQYRLEDLVASRDALGIVAEMRAYERQRKTEEENFSIEQRRRNQDWGEQLAEMEDAFQEQRQDRLDNYELMLADQQEDFERQQTRAQEAHEDQLKEMEKAHRDQLTELKNAKAAELERLKFEYGRQKDLRETTLADEYRMMSQQLGLQKTEFDTFWTDATKGWKNFIEQIQTMNSNLPGYGTTTADNGTGISSGGSATPGNTMVGISGAGSQIGQARAYGGYASFGRYILGEAGSEFVLNAGTTRAAERVLKSSLTQQNILASLVSGSSGGSRRGASLSQTFVFNSEIDEATMVMVRREAYRAGLEGLLEATEGY